MRAITKRLLISVIACLLAMPAFAQNPPPPTAVSPPFPGLAWYRQSGVRQMLNINEAQLNRLNDAYDRLQTRYQEDVGRLARLNEAERAARLRELNSTYRNDLNQAFAGFLEAKQMARYRQLSLQYQGIGAFGEQDVQKRLILTDEQRRRLEEYNQQYDQALRGILERAQTNRDDALKHYNALQEESRERINAILSEQQRRTWGELIGEPFEFPPSFGGPNR